MASPQEQQMADQKKPDKSQLEDADDELMKKLIANRDLPEEERIASFMHHLHNFIHNRKDH
jgi:hypothetical protein